MASNLAVPHQHVTVWLDACLLITSTHAPSPGLMDAFLQVASCCAFFILSSCAAQVGGVRRFIDISVPRNVASACNELVGQAIVYNVDDLKEVVAGNKEARQQVRSVHWFGSTAHRANEERNRLSNAHYAPL